MSLDPGDYDLNTNIGNEFSCESYLVVSTGTGSVWTFENEEQVQKFLVGRRIESYAVYSLNSDLKTDLEKKIYGEAGQFDKYKNQQIQI